MRNSLRKLARCGLFTLLFGAAALLPLSAPLAAQTITGIVTNKTVDKPSAGDDVVLLKLAQGMQEIARGKTDARGRFSIKVPTGETEGLHMIRVTHDKATYFRPVQPGTQSVEVEVYNAKAQLDGVSLSEDVMQVQTEPGGQSLRIVEHFLVRNQSEPAMTLFSEHPFELNLPEGATVEGAAAKSPGGMAVQSAVVPEDKPGHYTIIFPIRPGDTEFHVWYHVPYTGSFTFKPKPTMDTTNLAVMMPKSMAFKQGTPANYEAVTEDVGTGAQAFLARNAKPSEPLDFTVSGTGQLPRDTSATQGAGGASDANPPAGAVGTAGAAQNGTVDDRPGGGLGVPVDKDAERDPWTKYRWWIIGGLGLIMATAAGFMLRSPASTNAVARPSGGAVGMPHRGIEGASTGGALQALRDEMFAIETDRLEGRLSPAEYSELKSAFDVVLRRALARSGTQQIVTE